VVHDAPLPTLREAVLQACRAFDPQQQGAWWPDPVAQDGRPLEEQAHTLLILADSALRGGRASDEVCRAALALRLALGQVR
jgi:hypothetical protein